jgi:hypothetical protein
MDEKIKEWQEIREKEWTAEQAAQGKKPKEEIWVNPNPNHDGYDDNWVCEHIPMQVGQHDGAVWLCEACADKLEAGAVIMRRLPTADEDSARRLVPPIRRGK